MGPGRLIRQRGVRRSGDFVVIPAQLWVDDLHHVFKLLPLGHLPRGVRRGLGVLRFGGGEEGGTLIFWFIFGGE